MPSEPPYLAVTATLSAYDGVPRANSTHSGTTTAARASEPKTKNEAVCQSGAIDYGGHRAQAGDPIRPWVPDGQGLLAAGHLL